MLEKKGLWYSLMGGALVLWAWALLAGLVYSSSLSGLALLLLVLLVVTHALEIPVSSRIGREKGLSTSRVVVMTMIFGFTWWVAVRRGVIDR